jgi:bla regulator protein BlaR1
LLAATGIIAAGISSAFGQGSGGQQAQTVADARSAQSIMMPDWQKAAGGSMSFDVASVRPTALGKFTHPNFPLSPDEAYHPTGGELLADFTLGTYIEFAYKLWLTPEQREAMFAHLPSWTKTDHFTIQARGPVDATKDQMRLMMQSLLADRFGLKMHFEARETSVLVMTLAHPDRLGPKLRPHSEGPACDKVIPVPPDGTVPTIYPLQCGSFDIFFDGKHPGILGSRNTTMDLIAESLPGLGHVGRPIVNHTGLTGRYDFTLSFAPDPEVVQLPLDSEALQAPTLLGALKEQLGMRLDPAKLPMEVLVIDHIERPSEN